MTSRTERFERKAEPKSAPKAEEEKEEDEEAVRFAPEEEAALLLESQEHKAAANEKFAAGEYAVAIETYDKALASCPKYLHYERAVLRSNVAACHLKLEDWQGAAKAAGESLDSLGDLDPKTKKKGDESEAQKGSGVVEEPEKADEEIVSSGAAVAEDTSAAAKRKSDVERIRSKALLRRARARSEMGGWSALAGAEEDYKELSRMANLSPQDRKVVQGQLRMLPPRTKEAQEKEMGDMMGKLKNLGNGILSPFGLSTDNFQMVKDEATGGYSMNFNK